MRLPDCQNARETVVLAHLDCIDKGRGLKSPDWWAVYACAHCHDILDGRKKNPTVTPLMLEQRKLAALYETQKLMFEEGIL